VGTGGTISGTSRYLKEASGGRVRIVGADPESSRYAGGDGSPYYAVSIGHSLRPQAGEDARPESFGPGAVDQSGRVGDRESLADSTATAGQALAAADAAQPLVLVVVPRPSRPHGLAASEVIGSFSPARLAASVAAGRAAGDAPVTAHADAPPPTAGTGQSALAALAALGPAGPGPDAVLVLRDGRARAIVTRAELAAAQG
jgi:hypothetical protein